MRKWNIYLKRCISILLWTLLSFTIHNTLEPEHLLSGYRFFLLLLSTINEAKAFLCMRVECKSVCNIFFVSTIVWLYLTDMRRKHSSNANNKGKSVRKNERKANERKKEKKIVEERRKKRKYWYASALEDINFLLYHHKMVHPPHYRQRLSVLCVNVYACVYYA